MIIILIKCREKSDTKTGRITVLRCVQALDIGKAINPRICYGQVHGAMVMGLGYALCEELQFDDFGRILNPTPRTYRLPVAKDVPPMEVIFVEQLDPYGPFGAKAITEVGVNCMAERDRQRCCPRHRSATAATADDTGKSVAGPPGTE